MTIFGKQPAFWLGVLQAVFALVLTFHEVSNGLGLTDERVGLIMAVLFAAVGAYQAWAVRDTMTAALTAVAKAVLALLAAYNFELSVDQIAALLALLAIASDAVFLRDRTSPLVQPSFSNGPTAPILTQAEVTRAA